MKIKKIISIVLLALLMLSCGGGAAVHDVVEAPVITTSPKYGIADVRGAIIRAGQSLGWQIRDNGKQRLLGTLFIREHEAQVDIDYTRKVYSIRYHDSRNLNYDGTKIHGRYNSWVDNLHEAIRKQLLLI